ncbi:MAG TPA: peptidylprolyl isomerase [Candidatus Nanoarchaeia archaeon]|nr:peptidylprolyl isomerase [Candidatus Nanoarchaeia archaeon]
MVVSVGSTVKIHYKGTFDDGTVFDESANRAPLEFTVGTGKVIPGFEKNVLGMEQGQKKQFTVAPKDGYGEPKAELLIDLPRTKFPQNMELKPGMVLTFKKDETHLMATVRNIGKDSVQLDMNHPLAGKNLNFEIEVLAIL